MAVNAKSLRNKELSQMTSQELRDFIKKGEGAGLSLSTSKELGKAQNLLKVLEPTKYGSKTVESAKTSLQTQSSIPTLQKLGIEVPTWKQQQATPTAGAGATGLSGGMTSGVGVTSGISSEIPSYNISNERKTAEAEYNKLTTELEQAKANINDNPYFAEATRTGRIAKLNERATDKLTTLQNRVASLKADEQVAYNVSMDRYKLQQDQIKQNIDRLKMYIDTGAILNASAQDIAKIGVSTGMSQAMLQGIISRTRADIAAKNAPSMGVEFITNDKTGEVQVISYNKSTGQISGTNSLGKLKAGSLESDFDKDINTGLSRLRSGETWGSVYNSIYSKYAPIASLQGDSAEALQKSIDAGLGSSFWSKEGAYEYSKRKPASVDDLIYDPSKYSTGGR
jgi:hypothetical protein